MNDSDLDMLRATAAGDRDAFDRFVRRHTPMVLRFCLGRLRDRHGSEDATQESMFRLYEQVRRNRVPAEPLPWLFGIARRCCQEAGRRRKRDSSEPLREEDGMIGNEARCEEIADLREAMSTLNDFEAAVLHLKHTEGLRCRQIGQRLDKPLGTVTATLSRAYAKLRAKLDQKSAP